MSAEIPTNDRPMDRAPQTSTACAHDWVPMLGAEVCYGCNQMRRYDSVTYTAPEPLPPAAPVERGEPEAVREALVRVLAIATGSIDEYEALAAAMGLDDPTPRNIADALLASRAAPPSAPQGVTEAVGLIIAERERQKSVEGWSEAHDDEHVDGALAQAAACYAWVPPRPIEVKRAFPWPESWKPELGDSQTTATSRERVLVKAGALIVAEIERLQRLAALAPQPTEGR